VAGGKQDEGAMAVLIVCTAIGTSIRRNALTLLFEKIGTAGSYRIDGAGDRDRTGDIQLGKTAVNWKQIP
jgi:hypothetical protein